MSNAEKFINEHIRYDSKFWVTPNDARKAVELAREEIYEWLRNHYRDYMYNPTGEKLEAFFGGDMINDLEQAMTNE